jgi:hypothetical protein
MVARASERGPVAREITRTLDDRHAAILRKVGAERDQVRLAALWDDLCGRGLIAGAYWALMSHGHVAEPLKMHAFGEVHMLSHVVGGCNRHNVKELWLAQRWLDQLADTVARARRQAQETIAARDRKISELEHELRKARPQLATTQGGRPPRSPGTAPVGRLHRPGADRGGRRLGAARARLGVLEAENQRLQALLGVLIETARPCQRCGLNPSQSGPSAKKRRSLRAAASSTSAVAVSCCRICGRARHRAMPPCCITMAVRRKACTRSDAWSIARMSCSARSTV